MVAVKNDELARLQDRLHAARRTLSEAYDRRDALPEEIAAAEAVVGGTVRPELLVAFSAAERALLAAEAEMKHAEYVPRRRNRERSVGTATRDEVSRCSSRPRSLRPAFILRHQERPGFTESYHRVVFAIDHDGLDDMEVAVWVHPAYPEDQLVPVARAILAGRLASMAEAASEGAMTPDEVDALWQRVKPATIEGEPA